MALKKVDLDKWGGTKVRNNLKSVWTDVAEDDADFGVYQQALATNINNGNELIDWKGHIEGVLARRPF